MTIIFIPRNPYDKPREITSIYEVCAAQRQAIAKALGIDLNNDFDVVNVRHLKTK